MRVTMPPVPAGMSRPTMMPWIKANKLVDKERN